jgi:hypothetical protein
VDIIRVKRKSFSKHHLNPILSFNTLEVIGLVNYTFGGNMKITVNFILFSLLVLAGCSSLTLKPGDFAWPVESVSKVDVSGKIEDKQYYFSLNVKELLFAETQDSMNVSNVTMRIIRDGRGFFFITASKFKHVYVFQQIDGGLKLAEKILVATNGLENPALNQRPPFIELLNEQNPPILLTKEGVLEGEKK